MADAPTPAHSGELIDSEHPRLPRVRNGPRVNPMNYALLVPADPTAPLTYVSVRGLDDIAALLRGDPESTRYDHDALTFVHGEGRSLGMPLNTRTTDYIKTASAAARLNPSLANDDTGYGLYGDVVITGPEPLGVNGVPARLVEWFEAQS